MKKRRHPKVLPFPLPVYIDNPKYPEMIRVSFEDGHVRNYVQEVQQPPPYVVSKTDLQKMFRRNPGYHERRPMISSLWKSLFRKGDEKDDHAGDAGGNDLRYDQR